MIEAIKKSQEDYKIESDAFRQKIETNFISRTEFAPVKLLVYGAASIIFVAVFGALVALVIKS